MKIKYVKKLIKQLITTIILYKMQLQILLSEGYICLKQGSLKG